MFNHNLEFFKEHGLPIQMALARNSFHQLRIMFMLVLTAIHLAGFSTNMVETLEISGNLLALHQSLLSNRFQRVGFNFESLSCSSVQVDIPQDST